MQIAQNGDQYIESTYTKEDFLISPSQLCLKAFNDFFYPMASVLLSSSLYGFTLQVSFLLFLSMPLHQLKFCPITKIVCLHFFHILVNSSSLSWSPLTSLLSLSLYLLNFRYANISLYYFCYVYLTSMDKDKEAWCAAVRGVAKSQT